MDHNTIHPSKQSDNTPLGFLNFRNRKVKFGIKVDDRRRHVYVVGKTGVGKSTLLENMIVADIRAGRGVGVIDPHGELAEKILEFVPEERLDDVIYFNPSDMEYPIAFNPMEQVNPEFRHLVASGLMGVFKKIWPDVWSARMEYILNNTLLALLELPGSTLLGILRMYSDPAYRKKIVENLKDPVVKGFWQGEFAKYTQRLETEAVAAIQNKVGQFVSNPLVRNILGQGQSTINMREIMDNGKIFIANLSKGRIGEDNSALLGSMVITRLQLAAMSRVDIIDEAKRRDFFLYVDEFQNFATDSFASILSEARKYRLSLVIAHQYIGQLVRDNNTKVRDAVFGNVGTIATFRVGAADAEFLEKEFMPEFLQTDLVNLAKANVYIKLMIDGVASRPFSAETPPPQKIPLVSYRDVIVENSRNKYGTPRKVVDDKIASEWLTQTDSVSQEKNGRRGEQSLRTALGNPPPERRQEYAPRSFTPRDGMPQQRPFEERPRREESRPVEPPPAEYQAPPKSWPKKKPELPESPLSQQVSPPRQFDPPAPIPNTRSEYRAPERPQSPQVRREESYPRTPRFEPREGPRPYAGRPEQREAPRPPAFGSASTSRGEAGPIGRPPSQGFDSRDATRPHSPVPHEEKRPPEAPLSRILPKVPKVHPKTEVNIADLRKAISESLGKKKEPEDEEDDIGYRLHDQT